MTEIDINQIEYSNGSDGPVIHVFGRDKDGASHRLDVVGFHPYFYISKSQAASVPPDLRTEDNNYVSIHKEELVKVYTKKPSDVKDIREKFMNGRTRIAQRNINEDTKPRKVSLRSNL